MSVNECKTRIDFGGETPGNRGEGMERRKEGEKEREVCL